MLMWGSICVGKYRPFSGIRIGRKWADTSRYLYLINVGRNKSETSYNMYVKHIFQVVRL